MHGPVRELDPHVEHLGAEVAVGEAPLPERPTVRRCDADRGPLHVRLELDRRGDAARQHGRGGPSDRNPEILVEDPPQLDPRFEGERLPLGDANAVDPSRAHVPLLGPVPLDPTLGPGAEEVIGEEPRGHHAGGRERESVER